METHSNDYSMLEVTRRSRAGGKRRRTQAQESRAVIDLTGEGPSDETCDVKNKVQEEEKVHSV